MSQIENVIIPPGRTVATGVQRLDPWTGWKAIEIEAFRTRRRNNVMVRYRARTKDGQWTSGGSWLTLQGALSFIRWEADNTPRLYRWLPELQTQRARDLDPAPHTVPVYFAHE